MRKFLSISILALLGFALITPAQAGGFQASATTIATGATGIYTWTNSMGTFVYVQPQAVVVTTNAAAYGAWTVKASVGGLVTETLGSVTAGVGTNYLGGSSVKAVWLYPGDFLTFTAPTSGLPFVIMGETSR